MRGIPEIVAPGAQLTTAMHHAGKVLQPPKETPRPGGAPDRNPARGRPALVPYGPDQWARLSCATPPTAAPASL